MEQEAIAADRLVSGRDHRLSGTLRVTASETLAYRLLTPHLAAFRERHPGIRVELIVDNRLLRSEEHTSELQSLMRISYAVFCLKKKKNVITILRHDTDRNTTTP